MTNRGLRHPQLSGIGRALLFLFCALHSVGCTTTYVVGDKLAPEEARDLRVGSLELSYHADLPADRRQYAEKIGLTNKVSELLEAWLGEANHWGGPDQLKIEITRFRLPSSGRWATGALKGSDFLAAKIAVRRGDESIAAFDVELVLGAGDRSIGENYSADRAFASLAEGLAWSIAYEVAPRGTRGALLDIGKRELVVRAIKILYTCRELSMGEELKYQALGKLRSLGFDKFGRRPEFCRQIY